MACAAINGQLRAKLLFTADVKFVRRISRFALIGVPNSNVALGCLCGRSLVRPNFVGEPFQIAVEDFAHHHFHHGLT